MSLLNFVLLDSTILDNTSLEVITEPDRTHWITIEGDIIYTVKIGSTQCELVLGGKSSLNFVLLNPERIPLCGQAVEFINEGKLRFGGFIQTAQLNSDQSESVKEYAIECIGWEGQLERILVKHSKTDKTIQVLIDELFAAGGLLVVNGFTIGHIDNGPVLALVDADYVRASEYLRDIADASGGMIEVSPLKEVNFRKNEMREAPFTLTPAEVEYIEYTESLEEYVNQMTVGVTGTNGATANITRADPAEIAKRQALEGGSGVYEAYEELDHPTSNDVVELARLGVSVAFLAMQSRSRLNTGFHARLRRDLLEVGQLVTVAIAYFNLEGQYQITRMSISDEDDKILFDIEATFTNKRQLNLDSLLKIARAAKTTIVIPTSNFQNTVEFTTLGSQTWNVPGSGTVQVEIETNGAGGGGANGVTLQGRQSGGRGGNGGRAVSFREYAAGTTLTIFVGTGGVNGLNGTAGTASYVDAPSEAKVARGYGGGGGYGVTNALSAGAAGLAEGDYEFVGGGMPGGEGGVGSGNDGQDGQNGKVVIRY